VAREPVRCQIAVLLGERVPGREDLHLDIRAGLAQRGFEGRGQITIRPEGLSHRFDSPGSRLWMGRRRDDAVEHEEPAQGLPPICSWRSGWPPLSVFGGPNTLHFDPENPAFVLLPIVPAADARDLTRW